ncbi:MAG: AI-2E family transporter [Myxococcales bacterium]|nr:AI-2E family transporter [Myxococcales bacterium]
MTAAPPRLPGWLLVAMVLAAAAVFAPFWSWLVLAVWVGQLGRRMVPWLTRLTGRRQRAAAVLTAALIALLVVPIALVVATLIGDAIVLGQRLLASPQAREVFEQLVTKGASDSDERGPVGLLVEHGSRAWSLVSLVFAVAAKVLLGLFVFLSATYAVLADGPRAYAWFEEHLPLDPRITARFAAAFTETGRGLLVGVGGSGLAQALVATLAFVLLDVPEPLVLGLLTLIASVVPAVGTAMVWLPVAAGLWLTGRADAAVIMAVVGVVVIGSIDNVLRPVLARRGRLELPSLLIMVSMFGGIALVGAAGVVLGPLVVRLAKEALVIARAARVEPAPPEPATLDP